jgi:hypothetical protein
VLCAAHLLIDENAKVSSATGHRELAFDTFVEVDHVLVHARLHQCGLAATVTIEGTAQACLI